MENNIILTSTLTRRFETAMRRGRAVLFSAPCGFGKSAAARELLSGRRVLELSADDPEFSLPATGGRWDVLLVDDLQWLASTSEQEALCDLIRDNPERQFVLLTRGTIPNWLLPFQMAGVMTVLGPWDLALDRDGVDRLFTLYGISVSDTELTAIHMETRGCPLPLNLLIRHLLAGESYSAEVSQAVRRELYGYFDELVYSRLDLATRRLVMELAPFEPFSAELARLLSGSSRAGELLDKFQSVTSELLPEKADTWRFWPVFRNYLLWKFDNEYDGEKRRALYYRCGLYYELREEYKLALECYSKSGSSDKVMELLMRNAELHPGTGHYDEMEPYYRQLPEREILSSPALIQAMSMLCAISMDYEGSERWYKALGDFASSRRKADMAAKEARSRLAWREDIRQALDIANGLGFIRPISQYGSAALELVEESGWAKERDYKARLVSALREQAISYPDFMKPRRQMTGPLSEAERQVLRLICADKSNAEIGEILGIKLATVKVHVSHILVKLNVSRRSEAKTAAEKLRLI